MGPESRSQSFRLRIQIGIILAIGLVAAAAEFTNVLSRVRDILPIAALVAGAALASIVLFRHSPYGDLREGANVDNAKISRLDAAVADTLNVLAKYGVISGGYLKSLEVANNKLRDVKEYVELRKIVDDLREKTSEIQSQVSSLSAELEASRSVISRLRSDVQSAQQMANTDSLTGVSNRREFDSMLDAKIAILNSRSEPFALLISDLDNFKAVNDNFGHQIGDALLREFANLWRECLVPGDFLARIGGDEFAVILQGGRHRAAVAVAEEFGRRLRAKKWVLSKNDRSLGRITSSIGVAIGEAGDSAQTIFARADSQLFEAKRDGRDRVKFEIAA